MKTFIGLLCLLAICFTLTSFRPSAWVPVSLDSRVSVLFPAAPQEMAAPAPAKVLYVKETAGTYMVVTTPLGKDFQGSERKQYYDSVIEGALESGNGKLEGRSTFTIEGYDGISFTASIVRPDNQNMTVTVRCLIIDKKSYILQFISPIGSKSDGAQSKQFFESITLKPVTK